MAIQRYIAKPVLNTADALSYMVTAMVSAGWTLVDDQWSTSKYYILKNNGGEDGSELDMYFELNNATGNRVNFAMYTYWNAATHTGTFKHSATSYYLSTYDADPFTIWFSCNKDFGFIAFKLGITYYIHYWGKYFRLWPTLGTLQSGVSAGTDVVLTLGSGQADDFYVDEEHLMLENSTNTLERVTIKSVNKSANTVTVDTTQNWSVGAKIGNLPYPYIFTSNMVTSTAYSIFLRYNIYTNADQNNNTGGFTNTGYLTATDPDENTLYNASYPLFMYYSSSVGIGYLFDYISYWKIPNSTSSFYENTIEIGRLDNGTVTSSSNTNQLTDTSKSWSTNEWVGKPVIIISGPGQSQMARITSNTSDTLIFDIYFDIALTNESTYTICEEAWIQWQYNQTNCWISRFI
jgi:hypothetical protein